MSDDDRELSLVERLRDVNWTKPGITARGEEVDSPTCLEAADEIELLQGAYKLAIHERDQARNKIGRLREAMGELLTAYERDVDWSFNSQNVIKEARSALNT